MNFHFDSPCIQSYVGDNAETSNGNICNAWLCANCTLTMMKSDANSKQFF